MSQPLLKVEGLTVKFRTEQGEVTAVDRLSFELGRGESLGLVGESGCGKSVTCLAIMRLLPQPLGRVAAGRVMFEDRDLASLPRELMQTVRGRRIAMIFQEPMTALNPVETIGEQLREVFWLHFKELSPDEVRSQSLQLLKQVGIAAPEQQLDAFPHQLSGGMRQRAMIAMALACKPDILIADEPTTALDVTIQAQILDLLRSLKHEFGMSIIFITHDLGVVAETCDRVLVMYGGKAVETGRVSDVYAKCTHPYTKGLLSSLPSLSIKPKSKLATIPGMVPPLHLMPTGCRFQSRCPYAQDICKTEPVPAIPVTPSQTTWCIRYPEIGRDL